MRSLSARLLRGAGSPRSGWRPKAGVRLPSLIAPPGGPAAGGHRGRVEAPILVIGQAPGRMEKARGLPFIGPSGRRLMAWMAEAGFSEQEFLEKCYFSAITKCFPGPTAKGDRRPTPRQIAFCRPHLLGPLPLLEPKVLLLVGQMAIEAFLEKRPLNEWAGRVEERAGRHWIPLPHPSGASLWLNQPGHRALVEQALDKLGRLRPAMQW